MRRAGWAVIASGMMLMPGAACAAPETIDQLEPEGGEWEVEWQGFFGGEGEQSFEALYGLNDHLAIGAEVEFEGPRDGVAFEEVSAVLLYRFTDPTEKPVGFGILGEVSMARGGEFSGFSVRAITESKRAGWWLQGNAILRHDRGDGRKGTGFAYSASVQADVAGAWFGIEASGQAARLSGNAASAPRGRHYAGPSLTFEKDVGEEAEIEIGLAWLERLKGHGPGSGPRLFIQYIF